MQYGFELPASISEDNRVAPATIRNLVAYADEVGIECVWSGEHVAQTPSYSAEWMEPLTTLSNIAGENKSIDTGTAILLLPLRHPSLVAKAAKSMYQMTGERFHLGVGVGSLESDFQAVEIPYDDRFSRFDEGLKLLYRLLNEENVSFHGDYFEVENLTIPPTLDRPPLLLTAGGGFNRGGERMVYSKVKERSLYSDGWVFSAFPSPKEVIQDWNIISDYLVENGESTEEYMTVALEWVHLVPESSSVSPAEKQRTLLSNISENITEEEITDEKFCIGSIEEVKGMLDVYRNGGIDQLCLMPLTHDPDEVRNQLDLWETHLING